MKFNIHALLHVSGLIEDLGPMPTWLEYSLEGYCSLLEAMIRSQVGHSFDLYYKNNGLLIAS